MCRLKRIIILFAFLTCWEVASGQRLEVQAPTVVAVGKAFNVEFSINAKPDNFSLPEIENIDILAGPTSSRFERTVITQGKVEQNETYAFTYVMMASVAGTFTIPPAKAVIGGKEYVSKPTLIEAVQEAVPQSSTPSANTGTSGRAPSDQQKKPETISSEDLFLTMTADKTKVYKGEPIRVTLKLYYRQVPIAGYENLKFPAFNGFWVQELSTDQYTVQRETHNGKVYNTQILKEYLAYPQQHGQLQVEPCGMTIIAQVMVQSRRQSILDDIFGGIPDVKQISKNLSTAAIPITVIDWPSGAPEGFGGAVGNFTMSSEFLAGAVPVNSSANYTLRISGTGNLPLIQAPKLYAPESFEQYNIKTTESLQRSLSGISGYRQFEYPLIPRAEGEYSIEPIRFSYFDPGAARYVTLTTPEETITVLADSLASRIPAGSMVSGLTKEDLKILGQDIRFIKLGSAGLSVHKGTFMGSYWYFAVLLLLIGLFFFALIYLQKRIRLMQNEVIVKGKRANKVALQRLKAAEGYMKQGSQRNFYEEILKGLWGYMGDKLNIPAANLTKENVREGLLKRGIRTDYADRYVDLITECEYAQYSPANPGGMNEAYRTGLDLISKFESLIKR